MRLAVWVAYPIASVSVHEPCTVYYRTSVHAGGACLGGLERWFSMLCGTAGCTMRRSSHPEPPDCLFLARAACSSCSCALLLAVRSCAAGHPSRQHSALIGAFNSDPKVHQCTLTPPPASGVLSWGYPADEFGLLAAAELAASLLAAANSPASS